MKVTDKQIIDAISSYMIEHGWSPSLRDLAALLGMQSHTSVAHRLQILHQDGRIVYEGYRKLRVIR